MPFSDYRTALVTGATGGIGGAIVRRLRREGLEVFALGRNEAALRNLVEETGARAIQADIIEQEAMAEATSRPFDILVNNAGINHGGSLFSATDAQIEAHIQTNLTATIHITRRCLTGMIERGRGHIITITSLAAYRTYDGHTIYHAAKAGLHMFISQLRLECFGHPVRITDISPGRTETAIFAKTEGIGIDEAKSKFFDGYGVLQPTDIADAVAYAISAPANVNIGHIEITPTMQVTGGLRIAHWPEVQA